MSETEAEVGSFQGGSSVVFCSVARFDVSFGIAMFVHIEVY